MRILISIHMYLPQHACGGEMYCHNMAKFLIGRGHEVRVLLHEAVASKIDAPYIYEGVEVFPPTNDKTILFSWAELVITHLGWAAWTIYISSIFKKPCLFVSHNFWPYDVVERYNKTNPEYQVGVIYNSNAMKGIIGYNNNSFVLHPPVDYRKYDFGGPTGEYITLVNANLNKGARLFLALCKALPERKFLAIRGSYDTQFLEDLPNLTIWDNSPDMERVYRATRILLVPSAFESWGMVATEAMSNGIPVIYNETPGLKENVGDAGICLKNLNPDYKETELKGGEHPGIDPVANLEQWVKAIRKLNIPNIYKKYVILARARAKELDPLVELDNLEKFLFSEAENNRRLQNRELRTD